MPPRLTSHVRARFFFIPLRGTSAARNACHPLRRTPRAQLSPEVKARMRIALEELDRSPLTVRELYAGDVELNLKAALARALTVAGGRSPLLRCHRTLALFQRIHGSDVLLYILLVQVRRQTKCPKTPNPKSKPQTLNLDF